MDKYELTNETINHNGTTLYRIKALRDFNDVKKNSLGGFIEKEDNLSHEGNAWIYDNVRVFGNVEVFGNAKVLGDAWVFDNALVYGNAEVYGDARVFGDATVLDNAKVYGDARVFGDADVYGNTLVKDVELNGDRSYNKNIIINPFTKDAKLGVI